MPSQAERLAMLETYNQAHKVMHDEIRDDIRTVIEDISEMKVGQATVTGKLDRILMNDGPRGTWHRDVTAAASGGVLVTAVIATILRYFSV